MESPPRAEVINLIKDMLSQLEKEAKEDEEVYEKVLAPLLLEHDEGLGRSDLQLDDAPTHW